MKEKKDINRKDLLKKIQEVEFAIVDLNLYLDTHPKNQRALADYNMLTNELFRLKKIYEMNYGPLTNFGYAPSHYPWQWIESPWPWEL
ncbi:spore coat protein JB [Caminicella sporogenes DSM 14501]|uniref:Spore coat protein JB n=1 Tax=Caminicella sporogenes DSM 14501 TaxID=1121266 RepID=A0A1M6MWD8_9FIRM|nr:spore coat protein CotJB [Caminicella sporogenes]RKD22471.1 spore coat protein CotJB [Caminicella sporogenes]WIF94997.1 spore coat protein CotJB [Caminicella sporogenes]SHJ87764.1 spore coat protein JB [Caminicella sporogenes DSM 14501]